MVCGLFRKIHGFSNFLFLKAKESSRRSLAAPSSHTTVRAMSHTAVSVRGCLKSKGYGKSIGKFLSEGAYRDGIPERLAG